MDFEGVKETLNNDHFAERVSKGAVKIQHAMKVEKDEGLFETRRQLLFRVASVNGTTGVGDEFAVFVVNGNDHTTRH